MSLEKTLKEIKALKPFAEENTDIGPIETMSGRRGRKNQAIEQLRQLKLTYKRDLMNSALFLIVVGSERAQFEEITTNKKFGLFAANPEEFFQDLSSRIPAALYAGKESVGNIFDVLGRHLEDKANELDIVGYPQLIFKESYAGTLGGPEAFTKLVKRAVSDQMGAEVVGIQAVNSILDKAIDKNHAGKTTPIVMTTDDLAFASKLSGDLNRLSPRVFLVQAGTLEGTTLGDDVVKLEEVNQKTVADALAKINRSFRQ